MSTTIIKPTRDVDLYVTWESIVDMPIEWGTRQDYIDDGVDIRRMDRADLYSASALWWRPSWEKDSEYGVGGLGSVPRSKIPEFLAVLESDMSRRWLGSEPEFDGIVVPHDFD